MGMCIGVGCRVCVVSLMSRMKVVVRLRVVSMGIFGGVM